MNSKELNKMVKDAQAMLTDSAGQDVEQVLPLVQKQIKDADLRSVVNILFPLYFKAQFVQPEGQRKAKDIGTATEDLIDSLPAGVSRRSGGKKMGMNPGLAGHVNQVKKLSRGIFWRFERRFTYDSITPDDFYWIAEQYEAQGTTLYKYAETNRTIGSNLEHRKLDTLGDLFEKDVDAYNRFIKKLGEEPTQTRAGLKAA